MSEKISTYCSVDDVKNYLKGLNITEISTDPEIQEIIADVSAEIDTRIGTTFYTATTGGGTDIPRPIKRACLKWTVAELLMKRGNADTQGVQSTSLGGFSVSYPAAGPYGGTIQQLMASVNETLENFIANLSSRPAIKSTEYKTADIKSTWDE